MLGDRPPVGSRCLRVWLEATHLRCGGMRGNLSGSPTRWTGENTSRRIDPKIGCDEWLNETTSVMAYGTCATSQTRHRSGLRRAAGADAPRCTNGAQSWHGISVIAIRKALASNGSISSALRESVNGPPFEAPRRMPQIVRACGQCRS